MSEKELEEVVEDLDHGIESEVEPEIEPEITSEMIAEAQEEGFLPESTEEETLIPHLEATESVEGTELDSFESAEIEEVEFLEDERLDSIIESILFASDRPVSLNSIKMVFKGTNIKTDKIKKALDRLAIELAGAQRGVTLEEVPGGYQLRTKIDNMNFISRTLKARPFRLSGPALEVLAIVAYKQPLIKSEIDEIRGVESGHLLRALMERNLVTFAGKSELPGKPMLYETTKKFLEIFSLRNLKELPTLSQIDELLPEGIGEEEEKSTLSTLTDSLSQQTAGTYSQGEEELNKISDELTQISATSDFFEQEKINQKKKKDADKAQNIREAIIMGEEVSNRDRNWLSRYDEALLAGESFIEEEVKTKTEADVKASEGSQNQGNEHELHFVEDEGAGNSLFEDESEDSHEHEEANDIADIDGDLVK